jgi:hypothetical protein
MSVYYHICINACTSIYLVYTLSTTEPRYMYSPIETRDRTRVRSGWIRKEKKTIFFRNIFFIFTAAHTYNPFPAGRLMVFFLTLALTTVCVCVYSRVYVCMHAICIKACIYVLYNARIAGWFLNDVPFMRPDGPNRQPINSDSDALHAHQRTYVCGAE